MTIIRNTGQSFADSTLTQAGTSGAQILVWSSTLQEYVPTIRGTNRSQANSSNYWVNDFVSGLLQSGRIYYRVNTNFVSSAAAATSWTLGDLANLDYVSQESLLGTFPANTIVPLGYQFIQNNAVWQSGSDRLTGATFDSTEQSNWVKIADLGSVPTPVWQANRVYAPGELFYITIAAVNQVYRVRLGYTSGATFSDTLDLFNADRIGQERISGFNSGQIVPSGFLITVNGQIWQRLTDGVTTATFNAAEQANWTALTNSSTISAGSITNTELANMAASTVKGRSASAGAPEDLTLGAGMLVNGTTLSTTDFPNFAASTNYISGKAIGFDIGTNRVYIQRVNTGVSGAILDATELAGWKLVSQQNTTSFPANTLIPSGYRISQNGQLWQSNANRITAAAFDSAEQANWTLLTAQNISLTTTGSGAATYNSTTGELNIPTPAAPTVLPNFTNLFGLIGNGTNVPVADSRLQFATGGANTITLASNASSGFVLENTGTASNISVAGTATANGNSISLFGQNGAGTNSAGGKVILSAGSSTGSNGSSIDFNTAPYNNTAGTTSIAATNAFGIYQNSGGIAVFEGQQPTNRITAFGSNALNVTAQNAGVLTIGNLSTGNVNIGSTNKTVNLNGVIKKPGLSIVGASRVTTNQAIPANTSTAIQYNSNSFNFGNAGDCATLNTTTGVITIARIGIYRVAGSLTITSATANLRGRIICNPISISATISPGEFFTTNIANTNADTKFTFYLNVTTAGTFDIRLLATAAHTVVATAAAAANSSLTIEELG